MSSRDPLPDAAVETEAVQTGAVQQSPEKDAVLSEMLDAPSNHVEPDDRWGYRAKRRELLARFDVPGLDEALGELTDALLREARYHATWPVCTAEKWRYDRMLWVFDVMLGEVPADSPAPAADDPGYRPGQTQP